MIKYYFIGGGNQPEGPILPTEFLKYGLTADTMICPEGGDRWVALRSIPGLTEYLRQPQRPYPDEAYRGNAAYGGGQPYPGAPYAGAPVPGAYPPPSNLVWAILTTVLCCLPLGIVAIIKASQVNELWMAGRVAEAYAASKAARTWSLVGAIVGIVFSILYVLYIIFAVGASTYYDI